MRSRVTLRYLTRPPSEQHHAKAGNLNHALAATSSAMVVVFDCDMACEPHFLSAMLPHFYRRVRT